MRRYRGTIDERDSSRSFRMTKGSARISLPGWLLRALVGGEAVAAVDGAAGSWLEGDDRVFSTLGANGRVASPAVTPTAGATACVVRGTAVVPESFGPGRFRLGIANEIGVAGGAPGGAAIETANRNPESALLIEALLIFREGEGLLAVDAGQQSDFGLGGQREVAPGRHDDK
jgi:hypothetical protein